MVFFRQVRDEERGKGGQRHQVPEVPRRAVWTRYAAAGVQCNNIQIWSHIHGPVSLHS